MKLLTILSWPPFSTMINDVVLLSAWAALRQLQTTISFNEIVLGLHMLSAQFIATETHNSGNVHIFTFWPHS